MEQANFLVHISFYIDDKTLAENLKKKIKTTIRIMELLIC